MNVFRNLQLVVWNIFLITLVTAPSFSLFAMETYSLPDGQGVPIDHKLIKLLNMKNGVFVEVGANDGKIQSNTCLLEKQYGWTGILIEPSPCLYQKLCLNRPNSQCFCCALGTFEQDGTYIYGDFNGNLMSSVGGQRLVSKGLMQVPVRSLQAILGDFKAGGN